MMETYGSNSEMDDRLLDTAEGFIVKVTEIILSPSVERIREEAVVEAYERLMGYKAQLESGRRMFGDNYRTETTERKREMLIGEINALEPFLRRPT
jgi:hypothetical protein